MITRRKFLQRSGLATTALLADKARLRIGIGPGSPADVTPLDPNGMVHFVDPLPIPEIAQHEGYRPSPDNPKIKVPYYRIVMRQIEVKVHRDLKPTRLWSYGPATPGPTFETRSGEGLLVEWTNALPKEPLLPIDHSIRGAEAGRPLVRTTVHVHGAKTRPESDGYPEDWVVPGESTLSYYPNQQDSAMLWYHDHAMGINRLNVYAGLLGAFVIRDRGENSLNLPNGKYEIPLVIYDRSFTRDAQLFYPVSPDPESPWVPDVFGNIILVNGKIFPYLDIEPRKYRFRVLNGSNGRFYRLSFANEMVFHQIGTDQGLLPAPVTLKNLVIAPGERADLIVDFSSCREAEVVLENDTSAVMQFRVSAAKTNDTSVLPSALRPVLKIGESEAVKTRLLTLNQYTNKKGDSTLMLLNASYWSMPVTEKPILNSTEIWTLINLTGDSHPIHLHLVRFQILDRRSFVPLNYLNHGELQYIGPAEPPEPNEAGWKDTVRADPKMVTRIIVRFEGYAGRYVWHCHILEHEDNEMMRPYDVITRL